MTFLYFAECQNPHCTPKLAMTRLPSYKRGERVRITKLVKLCLQGWNNFIRLLQFFNASSTSASEGHTRDSPWHASHRAMQLLTASFVASNAAGSDGDFFRGRLSNFAARINERRTTWKKRYQFSDRRGRLWKTNGRG